MTDFQIAMYSRLKPRTAWTGGRVTDTDLLTLAEAACMATQHAGQPVTAGDILRAAGRGEIPLRAIVHCRAKLQSHDGGICGNAGHPTDENVMPAGAIPTLPVSACQHLANVGRASWRTFDGHTTSNGLPVRFAIWQLTDDEPNFETVTDDCRVMACDLHALADEFKVGPLPLPPDFPAETAEQRQARRYQACIDAGLTMPANDYATLPRGVGKVAKTEGISHQAFGADVRVHINRLNGK